ncbi:MAG: hypothetical protein ACK5YR_23000 [Pirellula sp.]
MKFQNHRASIEYTVGIDYEHQHHPVSKVHGRVPTQPKGRRLESRVAPEADRGHDCFKQISRIVRLWALAKDSPPFPFPVDFMPVASDPAGREPATKQSHTTQGNLS